MIITICVRGQCMSRECHDILFCRMRETLEDDGTVVPPTPKMELCVGYHTVHHYIHTLGLRLWLSKPPSQLRQFPVPPPLDVIT